MILKKLLLFVVVSVVFVINVKAQIGGIVFDQISRKALTQVEVTNLNNNQKTSSNDNGEFSIAVKVNEVLVFRRTGYRSDTVLITQLGPIRRYLVLDQNTLNTVTISGKKELRDKYAQAFNKANPILFVPGRGLLFYPSGYFSRESKPDGLYAW